MNTDTAFRLTPGMDVTTLKRRTVSLQRAVDNEVVIYIARNLLVEAGFRTVDEFMVASAASELATNILRYAGQGTLDVSIIQNASGAVGIELFASDDGPGIENLVEAMQDHRSTTANSLGSGLPSVKRIMDGFQIESLPGRGTRVLARKWRQP